MGEHYLKGYVAAVAVLALALASAWVYHFGVQVEARFIVGAAVFAVLLAAAEKFPIRTSTRQEITALDVVLLCAVAALGPVWALAAVLPSALVAAGRDPLRMSFEAGRNAVEVFAAGMVFALVSEPLMGGGGASPAEAAYATGAAGIALLAVNHLANAGLLKARYGESAAGYWRENAEPYLFPDSVSVLSATLAVLALVVYGPLAAVVLVSGSVAGQALAYRARDASAENRTLKNQLRISKEALAGAGESFGAIVLKELGRKDGYRHLHAAATSVYAHDLALELGMDEEHARRIRTAGLLHDIGWYGLPDELLLTSGRLNSVGSRQAEEHSARGQEALKGVSGYEDIADWIRWHHERIDGRGYPDRLKGQWIPLESKVLAVASAYANAVLDKPSVPGASYEDAREHFAEGIGLAFDERVARALLQLLDGAEAGYRMADDGRFAFPTALSDADTRRTG